METKGKIAIVLGDSITDGYGVSDRANNVFAARLEKMLGFKKVINYGIGGTRYARGKEPWPEGAVYDMDFLIRYPYMKDNADLVMVFGGTNDYDHCVAPLGEQGDLTPYTFFGAVRLLYQGLKQKYEGKKILILTPTRRSNDKTRKNKFGKLLIDYVNAEKEIAAEFGFAVGDLYHDLEIDPDDEIQCKKYTIDGLHFNDLGHKLLADKIAEYIRNI